MGNDPLGSKPLELELAARGSQGRKTEITPHPEGLFPKPLSPGQTPEPLRGSHWVARGQRLGQDQVQPVENNQQREERNSRVGCNLGTLQNK